jgi:hypothetical protein
MGVLKVNLPNETFNIRIAGDEPTVQEQIKINDLVRERSQAAIGVGPAARTRAAADSPPPKEEQLFDTESGIKDAGLRAKLSAAETKGDAEAQLRVLYGMTETDYTRDKRGRLALTPSGGAKIGVELDRPTLIDEDKFTRYDLADFAGVVPEIVGGVGGGVGGAILGAPAGPLGMLLASAIGAGSGSAAGQALEEGLESIFGVQTQTAEEVKKDVATEFKIGFLSDVTLGAFGLLGRGAGNMMRAGKGLTDDELEIAAKSIEMGITPTLNAIRAPSVVARQQGIVEKIFGSSPRLKKNNEVMQSKLADYRSNFEKVSDEEAGRILMEGVGAKASKLAESQVAAQKAILQSLRGLGDDIGAAAEKNMELDEDVFNILINARNAFDTEVKAAFKPIDAALDSTAGSEQIFGIGNIRKTMVEIRSQNKAALASNRTARELNSALQSLDTLGKQGNVSFSELYEARKTLNDILAQVPSGDRKQRLLIGDLINKIDVKLSTNNVKATLDTLQVPEGLDRDFLLNAAEAIEPARKLYSEGAQVFEDIEAAGVIKNLAAKASNNQPIGVDDVAMDKIIRNNKPKVLERTLAAIDFASAKGVKGKAGESLNKEAFREQLAGQWLNDALSTSGLNSINDFDPTKFKPAAFAKAVKDLGKTADVLFGSKAGEVRKLASQMEKIGISNLKQADVDSVIGQIGEEADLAVRLKTLTDLQRAARDEQRSTALRDLQRGDLNPTMAADLIATKSTTATDIAKIFNAFEGDEAALQKIRGNYMERLISDFGDTLTTDGKSLGAFAKRLLEANEGGKLSAIFGKEMGDDMAEFAKILEFNARTAPGGDLVAANIAASPIQNLGKLAKFTIVGRLLTSGPYYKQIVQDYKKLSSGETAEAKARLLGRLIAQSLGQQSQEGVREVEQQISSTIDSSGLGEQIQNLSSQVQSQIPNNSTGIGQAAIVPPAPAAQQSSVRQQAAQNPAVAQALGIRGATAGLLGNP